MLSMGQTFYIQASEISSTPTAILQVLKLGLDRVNESSMVIQLEKDPAGM